MKEQPINKLHIFGIVILNTNENIANENTADSAKTCVRKNSRTRKKIYVNEIAAVNLSKIYFLKNAKKICKPSNRDLNRDWIKRSFNNQNPLSVTKVFVDVPLYVCN